MLFKFDRYKFYSKGLQFPPKNGIIKPLIRKQTKREKYFPPTKCKQCICHVIVKALFPGLSIPKQVVDIHFMNENDSKFPNLFLMIELYQIWQKLFKHVKSTNLVYRGQKNLTICDMHRIHFQFVFYFLIGLTQSHKQDRASLKKKVLDSIIGRYLFK